MRSTTLYKRARAMLKDSDAKSIDSRPSIAVTPLPSTAPSVRAVVRQWSNGPELLGRQEPAAGAGARAAFIGATTIVLEHPEDAPTDTAHRDFGGPVASLPGESTEAFVARSLATSEFIVLPNASPLYRVLKRGVDILGALILLTLAAPVLLVLTIAIRVDSPGPAIFRQTRVTRHGRHFRFYKFRTMYVDARERFPEYYRIDAAADGDDLFYKLADDPRNTRVGRWVRRTTLDELPNLFNVLRGDLSLVGPRPDLPELVRTYRPMECSCLLTKAGLTGMAQTRGRSLLTMRERLRLDLRYVAKQSLWLDLKILVRTAFVVIRGVGAF